MPPTPTSPIPGSPTNPNPPQRDAVAASDAEPSAPVAPPRFRWLVRLGVGTFAWLLIVVACRIAWGVVMDARLEARVQAIRDAGQPIDFEDLAQRSTLLLPPRANAHHHVMLALQNWPRVPAWAPTQAPARALLSNTPSNAASSSPPVPPAPTQPMLVTETDWYGQYDADPYAADSPIPDPVTDPAAYLAKVEAVLAHLRDAAATERSDTGVVLTRPAINVLLPYLTEYRRLAKLLDDAAIRAARLADAEAETDAAAASRWTALAFELVGHQTDIARAMGKCDFYVIIDHLVAISIQTLASGRVAELQHGLTPRTAAVGTPGREAVERVIADLLAADADLQRGFTRSAVVERWYTFDSALAVADGSLNFAIQRGWFAGGYLMSHTQPTPFIGVQRLADRPFWVRQAIGTLDYMNTVVEAGRHAGNQNAFEAVLAGGAASGDRGRYDPINALVVEYISGSIEASGRAHFLVLTRLRLGALALAVKLYEIDHGRRPVALSDLVPRYLAAVPADPQVPDGSPLRYAAEGSRLVADTTVDEDPAFAAAQRAWAAAAPAAVYGVGHNEVDDGAAATFYGIADDGEVESKGFGPDGSSDAVFLLDPIPRVTDAERDALTPP